MVVLWDAPLEPTETSEAVGGGSVAGGKKRKEGISAVQRSLGVEEGAYPERSLAEGHWSSNTKFSGLLMGEVTFLLPLPPSSSANC